MKLQEDNLQLLACRSESNEQVTWAEAVMSVWVGDAKPEAYELFVKWPYGVVDSTKGPVGPQNLSSKPHGNTKGAPE